ncbi:MAG: GAF domain-containing protein, partial [Anaerolineae bacterium]|nr:GAF domain-containing protein [Anaerolineae bacterium]
MISGITYTIIGYMMVHRLMEVPAGSPSSGEAAAWNSTGAVLLFLTLVIVFSLGQILEGLEKSLDSLNETLVSERQLTEELERESLELTEQSLTLERRLTQIRTAAQISSTLVKVLDPQTLMQTVVDMVKERFDLYYVGVFLVDNSGRFAILSAGTGEAGQRMLSEGHKLAVGGTSMMGWATGHGQPRIALDVGEEAIRFNNPHLPLTRSELALPLLYADQVVGGLTVQSTEPEAFDEADIAVLQQISDSLATALENARLFQQIETSLEEISNLNRQYLTSAWSEVLTRDEPTSFTYEAAGTPVLDKPPSALNIPLTLRDDQLIGNITLESERTDWSENELEFIEAVSTQAALALESARLLEETQRRVEREYALNQLTSRFSRSLDLDSLMKLVVQELGQLPKVKEVSIHIAPQ